MIDRDLQSRWRFFLKHAGYCTPPGRAECALELARAEIWREEMEEAGEIVVQWEYDPEPYERGDAEPKDYEPEQVLCCVLQAKAGGHWRTAAALCGIADPDEAYTRVIEAELASEALEELATAEARAVLSV